MTKVKPIVVSSDSDDHKTKNGITLELNHIFKIKFSF